MSYKLTSKAQKALSRMGIKNTARNNRKKETRKIAKQVVLSLAETKAYGIQTPGSPTVPALPLSHNQVYYNGEILSNKQGVADPNNYSSLAARIGDEIILKSVSVRFMLSALRPNVTYKLVLFWYSSELSTLGNTNVYFTQGNKLLDRYNTEQISIIDQKIVSPNIGALPADDANPRRTRLVTLNGNWKSKKIKYNEGSGNPRFKNIGFAIVAYDSINTLQTDQVAEMVIDYKVHFKDL